MMKINGDEMDEMINEIMDMNKYTNMLNNENAENDITHKMMTKMRMLKMMDMLRIKEMMKYEK